MKKLILFLCLMVLSIPVYAGTLYSPIGANPQVVFMGDSITYGSASPRFDYPDDFGSICGECTYLNKGVSADKTLDMVSRWTIDVVNNSPRYVAILGGVCDMGAGTVEKATFLSNYTTMLNSAKTNNIIPIVLPILPVDATETIWSYSHFGNSGALLDEWNADLISLAQTYSKYIIADCRSTVGQFRNGGTEDNLWDIKPAYSYDGVHLTEIGYGVLATCIWNAVNYSDYVIRGNGTVGSGANAILTTGGNLHLTGQ